jgi:hypothetical protein
LEELSAALNDPLIDADRKNHRKEILRDLKVTNIYKARIDAVMVSIFQFMESAVGMLQGLEDLENATQLHAFQQAVYSTLLACITGDLKNCVYMAQYLDFLQARLSARVSIMLYWKS